MLLGSFFKACLIALLIDLLVFPPGLMAGSIATWNGGDGNYSDSNWTCGDCTTTPNYPNNGNFGVLSGFDASIDAGSVNLDVSATVNTLSLGTTGALTINANTFTAGTPSESGTVLSNGGTLNVAGPGSAILQLGGGGTADNEGTIDINDGGSLKLLNTTGSTATFTNNNSFNLGGTTSTASLILQDGGNFGEFVLSGSGTLGLLQVGESTAANNIISGFNGTEVLTNDFSHTIAGTGTITNLAAFNNNGSIFAGSSLVLDSSNGGTFDNEGGLYANDGASITFRNTSGGTSNITNEGVIALNGNLLTASLVLDDGGNSSTFDISGNVGVLSLTGNSSITGLHGTETLVNDFGHVIQGEGTISNLNLVNNGTLWAAPNAGTGLLLVSAPLQNWDGANLNGGSYVADDGGTLQLSSIGGSTILGLNGALVQISGSGVLTGDGTTDALATLNNITNGGGLGLAGPMDRTITPTGGTLLLDATDAAGSDASANLLLAGGAHLTVTGNLTNLSETPSGSGSQSQVDVIAGASLTVTGNVANTATDNLSPGGANAYFEIAGGGGPVVPEGIGPHGVTNDPPFAVSSLAVTGGFTNTATNGGLAVVSFNDATGTIGGTFTNSSDGASAAALILGDSTVTVQGLFTNNNAGVIDALVAVTGVYSGVEIDSGQLNTNGGFDNRGGFVYVSGGGTLANTGLFNNTGGNIDLEGCSCGAAGTLTNTGLLDNTNGVTTLGGGGNSLTTASFTNDGGYLEVGAGDHFHAGTLTNLTDGTLSGGTYKIGGTFDSTSGVITAIAGNTSVTLTAENGGAASILFGSTNALATLASNAGSLTLEHGVTLDTTPGGDGTFTNTGTLTTKHGGNQFNVTGALFNTTPGVVNVRGYGDTVSASGQMVNSGTITVGGKNNLVEAGGDLTNSGTITINKWSHGTVSTEGSLDNSGSIEIGKTGTLTAALGVTQSGTVTVDDGGTLNVTSGTYTQTAGTTAIEAGATFNATNIDLQGGALTSDQDFKTGGTVTIDDGASLTVTDGTYIQTGGTTTVNAGGDLIASVDLQGGVLAGFGTITGDVLNEGGTLAPGDPGQMDIVGTYTQTLPGIMELQFASDSSFDSIHVDGDVSLGGTLQVDLASGFTATVGELFTILTWTGALSGDFDFRNLTSGGYIFQEDVHANDITLELIGADTSAAPEPSTFGLLLGGLMLGVGVSWNIRRRKLAAAR